MGNLMSFLVSPSLSAYRLVAATGAICRVNGREVPCGELWSGFKWLAEIGAGVAVIMFVVAVIAFIFWLWMVTDSIKRPIEHKPVWILVLLLTGLVGAIIYYFAVKRHAVPPPSNLTFSPPATQ